MNDRKYSKVVIVSLTIAKSFLTNLKSSVTVVKSSPTIRVLLFVSEKGIVKVDTGSFKSFYCQDI